MTLYLFGNLLGRLVVSYALVWLVLWLFSRRDVRVAFRKSFRWYGILAVLALFAIGAGSMYAREGFAV